MSETATEGAQETLFDLTGKEFNAYWVDEKAPLFIPNNPLHWKAHKLQVLIARLDKQSERNPAQFNSKNYIDALNEFQNLIEKIRKAADNEDMDASGVAGFGNEGTATLDGKVEPISMDS